jgi:two-component system, cell cycle sensor histidine kinase and response regulator CckA
MSTTQVGSQSILVVEDDLGLRQLAVRILIKAGFQVYSAGLHKDAEEIARRHGHSINLLLTDVVMPGMGGKELADRLTARFPALSVLYMSGYTDEVLVKQGVMEGTMHFLQKPFTPVSLVEKVREVLNSAEPGAHP